MAETSGDGVVAALTEALGELVLTEPSLRAEKAQDRSYHQGEPPLAVVQPRSTDEAAAAVRICSLHSTPVVPRGSGTGLEGGSTTGAQSICLDLSQMDQVLEVAADDMYARVQAGVMKSSLNAALQPHGLMFPVGPGVDASVGGMTSTSASGTTAVSYGTLKENVIGLTAVLADGAVITTGGITKKSSAGYDLTHLLVGAEGTLGVITEVTVKVHPIPGTAQVSVWSLPTLAAAAELVVSALRSSLRIARVELVDELTIGALASYNGMTFPVSPTLMVEFEGTAADVAAQSAQFRTLAETYAATLADEASDVDESARIWQARHDALPASLSLVPGSTPMISDVCVPISRLAESVLAAKQDVDDAGVIASIVGHVGDGNFHVAYVLPPEDPETFEKAKAINRRVVARALEAGGTCTGEHGIGTGKVASMAEEHASAIPAMQAIKQALDPQNIMNPGKVVPPRPQA